MAKPNYSFEKRQRELAKKKKKEEKSQRKLAKSPALADGTVATPPHAPTSADAGKTSENT